MNRYGYRAVVRLTIFSGCLALLPLQTFAQEFAGNPMAGNPYDASLQMRSNAMWTAQAPFSSPFPVVPTTEYGGPVSADVLRHPLSGKAQKMLQRALNTGSAGQHRLAIEELQETLRKYPAAAPYVHGGLGIEYAEVGQLPAAISELEKAIAEMPHLPVTHTVLARVLDAVGQYGRAEHEALRAQELDPHSIDADDLLLSLRRRKESATTGPAVPTRPAGN